VTFCSNSVEQCVADGGAWSVSTSLNGCESGTARPVDGGPAGAICCVDQGLSAERLALHVVEDTPEQAAAVEALEGAHVIEITGLLA
jgi:hypothetical protein